MSLDSTPISHISAPAAPAASPASSPDIATVLRMKASLLDLNASDFYGKRVLIRVDFNVPLSTDGHVLDTTRIEETLPTLQFILEKKPKVLILIAHLGRPNGQPNHKYSLKPVAEELEKLIHTKVIFVPVTVGEEAEKAVQQAQESQILLMENVRFHMEEEGKGKNKQGQEVKADKEDVKKFQQQLTKLGDIYVDDAFGAVHRAHSSITGIGLQKRVAGLLLQKELDAFARVLHNPARPFVAVLGGAKVVDKVQVIAKLLDQVDELVIGGGMAFTFLKVLKNMKISKSIYDEKGPELVPSLMEKAKQRGVKIHLPVDFEAGEKFDKNTPAKYVTAEEGIPDGWMGLDIGFRTSIQFSSVLWKAKTVVFNGPMGVFEFPSFANGTIAVLHACAAATQLNGAYTVLGGGDSVTAANQFGVSAYLSHLSTGGGASLELLEGKILPGIASLSDKQPTN